MMTAQLLVERSLNAFGDRIAIQDAERTLTFRQLKVRSGQLANALIELGATDKRPVATLLHNDAHFVEVDTACMRAGITRVGITTRLSADEVNFMLDHSRASVLVTSRALLEKLNLDVPSDIAVLLIDDATAANGFECILSRASTSFHAELVSGEHAAYIFYTSGTSGRPKGATHSQGGRAMAMANMLASELDIQHGDAMLHVAPVTHGGGSKILSFLVSGQRNLIVPRFDPEAFAASIKGLRATHSFMVPTMIQMLTEAGSKVAESVRGLRQISFGGAPISGVLFERALDMFGPIFTQVYGSCEAPHPVTVLRPRDYADHPHPGQLAATAGRASYLSQLRIVDEHGSDLASGAEGELLVRGPHLMSGYWNDAAATSEVVDGGGWYSTGDIAVIDEAGYVEFRDRKRDLIISGGFNVYPSEVERVLAEHPNVREVAVIGYPDERWGEAVMACVVLHREEAHFSQEVSAWIEGRLASYKRPKRYLVLAELPKGSTNKVLKRALRDRFWEGRGRKVN